MAKKTSNGVIIHLPAGKTQTLSPSQRLLHSLLPFPAYTARPDTNIPTNPNIKVNTKYKENHQNPKPHQQKAYSHCAKSVKEVSITNILASRSIGSRSISASSPSSLPAMLLSPVPTQTQLNSLSPFLYVYTESETETERERERMCSSSRHGFSFHESAMYRLRNYIIYMVPCPHLFLFFHVYFL